MAKTITMPSLGESVAEGEIGTWLVKVGQAVKKGDPLVEVLTDKADTEVPAPEAGVVTQFFAQEGDMIAVGSPMCEIDANATATSEAPAADAAPKASAPKANVPSVSASSGTQDAKASPAVRKLAREKGIDLSAQTLSSPLDRVTKASLNQSAQPQQQTSKSASKPASPSGAFRLPPYVERPGDTIVPFNRRRRIIADHMVYSKLTSPHVVTFAECDLHKAAKLREQHKATFKKEGLSLTYLAFVCSAVAQALREFPELNARVLDDSYALLKEINLGVAVDTPQGLVVPVIRNAAELSLRGIARSIGDIAVRARDGRLTPDDLANKTFTVSNPGRKGNLVGGAIISQPNVGILRIGEIKKRPVVVERDGEDVIAIHPVMYMALSYDHRIVDGVHANGFLWRINELLEKADFTL